MRRMLGLGAAVAACVVWTSALAGAESFAGKVTSISSGHIVQVEHDGKRELVVLNGVVSPDSKTPEGKLGKAFVANRALGQDVKVDVVKRSERIVTGTLFLPDGTDLAQLVLSEGMGTWNRMAAPDNTRYRDLEAGAKVQGLGLWAMEDASPAKTPATAPAAKPAGRVAPPETASAGAEPEKSADGKRPKLVLRGDADVAEAARAAFEQEKQAAAVERARQVEEQERARAQQEKQLIAQQKREQAEAIKAEQAGQAMAPEDGGVIVEDDGSSE